MVVVKIMLSIRACLKFLHLFFRSCFSFFQMDRRKGDSLGGCRYQAKRHRANGETIVMPLDRLIHGEKSCNPPQSTVAAEGSEFAHFPDPPVLARHHRRITSARLNRYQHGRSCGQAFNRLHLTDQHL
jgi:hypothetical protein